MNRIKQLRQERGLTLDDIENQTRIKRGLLIIMKGASDDIEYVDDHLDYAYNALRDAYEGLKDLHNASDKDYEGVGY